MGDEMVPETLEGKAIRTFFNIITVWLYLTGFIFFVLPEIEQATGLNPILITIVTILVALAVIRKFKIKRLWWQPD